MSINLMSAIFQTEFRDLQDDEGNTTKASTAKLVLLAMADCANDEGEGVYPSIDTLKKKCALSDQTIRNTFGALLHNGIIFRVGASKYGTHNHNINPFCFPKSENRRDFPSLLAGVKPVEGSNEYLNGSNELDLGVKSVDPKHPLTTMNPYNTDEIKGEYNVIEEANKKMDAILGMAKQNQPILDAQNLFESTFGFGSLPWDSKKEWQKFGKWIAEIVKVDKEALKDYVTWRNGSGKYQAMSNNKIRQNPQMFMDTGWPTFLAHSSMYSSNSPIERNPAGI